MKFISASYLIEALKSTRDSGHRRGFTEHLSTSQSSSDQPRHTGTRHVPIATSTNAEKSLGIVHTASGNTIIASVSEELLTIDAETRNKKHSTVKILEATSSITNEQKGGIYKDVEFEIELHGDVKKVRLKLRVQKNGQPLFLIPVFSVSTS